MGYRATLGLEPTWMLFGDLGSRLRNWPAGACYGLLFELVQDTNWTY